MKITDVTAVKTGNKYIARLNKYFSHTYLAITSSGHIVESTIQFAKEVDSIQEVFDLVYAYKLGLTYIKSL